MKKKYSVSKVTQSNGDNEVHVEGCTYLPKPEHRIELGQYESCGPAVIEARRYYKQVNGCYYCCNSCHTQ